MITLTRSGARSTVLIVRALVFMPWTLAQATLGSGRKRRMFGVITRSILIHLRPWSRRLGYRVRPSLIWQRKRYDTMELILGIVNDGVAGVPGVLGIYAETLDGRVRLGGNLDAGQPYAGQFRQASIILPKGMDGQQIKLRAELDVKGRSVLSAGRVDHPTNPDGSLTIRLKKGSDSGWRKGV